MDVQFAFVCESATREDGSLSATGIGRAERTLDATSLVICGQIGFSLLDIGAHSIDVELEDPDGGILWSESVTVEFSPPVEQNVAYGAAPFVFQLLDLNFESPGPHSIRIFTSGEQLYEIPLHLSVPSA